MVRNTSDDSHGQLMCTWNNCLIMRKKVRMNMQTHTIKEAIEDPYPRLQISHRKI